MPQEREMPFYMPMRTRLRFSCWQMMEMVFLIIWIRRQMPFFQGVMRGMKSVR